MRVAGIESVELDIPGSVWDSVRIVRVVSVKGKHELHKVKNCPDYLTSMAGKRINL